MRVQDFVMMHVPSIERDMRARWKGVAFINDGLIRDSR